MIDGIVTEEKAIQPGKDQVIIGVKLGAEFDVLVDALSRFLQGALCHRRGDSAPTTFPHTQNGSLANCPTPSLEFLVLVLIAFFATDEALVQFHDALELGEFWPTTSLSEPMQHEPSRLLSDADLLRQLQAGDALAGRDQQVHRIEPFMQRNVAALKDRASTDREIKLAGVAAVEATLARGDVLFRFTGRAGNALRPDAGFQKKPSRFRSREHLEKLEGRYCAFAHGLNVLDSLTSVKGVKYIVPK